MKRTAVFPLVAALLGAVLTGCDRSSEAHPAAPAREGGELRVVVGALPAHLDPQRVRSDAEANVSRLLSRTLTTYRSDPGDGAEAVGDLATDAGRPANGNQVWEFTLKPGVKWEDGSPITCTDVKYGIERSFSSVIPAPQPYPRLYLTDNPQPYAGPYIALNNNSKGLESLRCVDQRTIRFQLRSPVAQFGAVLAASVFAPVKAAADKKEGYDARPFASGPYRIGERTDQQLVLVRNPHWDRGTDVVRKAYPDRIVLAVNADATAVTTNLISGSAEWANTVSLDVDVASGFIQQVRNDPALADRVATGTYGAVRYLAVNSRRMPDLNCRKALVYAFNRRKFRDAAGGPAAGSVATSMIAPDVRSHRDVDPYDVANHPGGRVDEAKRHATQGAECPETVKVAFPDVPEVRRLVATMVEPYQAIGVRVRLTAIDPAAYWEVVGSPGNPHELSYASWTPRWSDGAAVIAPLFDGRLAGRAAVTNQNLGQLNDPEINAAITAALAERDPARQEAQWAALDQKIQDRAVTIPIMHPKTIRVFGTNVRGGFIHPRFGQPDLASLGLAAP